MVWVRGALSEGNKGLFSSFSVFRTVKWETRGCVRTSETLRGVQNIIAMKTRAKGVCHAVLATQNRRIPDHRRQCSRSDERCFRQPLQADDRSTPGDPHFTGRFAPDLDSEMLQSESKSWAWFMQGIPFAPITPDYLFSDGQEFMIGGVRFRVMGAPGHTAGSCLLFCEDYGAIFTGDVLFQGGIGRTDGFSGSEAKQLESLRRIRAINGDYKLLCGHGESTTLQEEKTYNPYLRNL